MRARPAVVGARRRHRASTGASRDVHAARGGPDRRRRRPPARRRARRSSSASRACEHRTLVRSQAVLRARQDDPLYAVRPLLHEPDPKSISWWQSATGWPIRAGERLKVTAAYDGSRPHTRVMGIDHVYVAPPAPGRAAACAPAPPDAQILGPEFRGARADAAEGQADARAARRGRARAPDHDRGGRRAPCRRRRARDASTTSPSARPPRRSARGAIVRWRFAERGVKHDVTLAAGPVGFGSPWLSDGGRYGRRFTEPGTYLLQCSLHAAYMSQVVHGHAVTTAPPRRGSPPPLNSPVPWWRSTAWQPPKNRLRSRNQASARPGGLQRRGRRSPARRRRARPRSAAAARRPRPARPSRGRSR